MPKGRQQLKETATILFTIIYITYIHHLYTYLFIFMSIHVDNIYIVTEMKPDAERTMKLE